MDQHMVGVMHNRSAQKGLVCSESSWLKDVVSSGLYPSRQSWFNVSNIQKRNLNFILSISSPTESIL